MIKQHQGQKDPRTLVKISIAVMKELASSLSALYLMGRLELILNSFKEAGIVAAQADDKHPSADQD